MNEYIKRMKEIHKNLNFVDNNIITVLLDIMIDAYQDDEYYTVVKCFEKINDIKNNNARV